MGFFFAVCWLLKVFPSAKPEGKERRVPWGRMYDISRCDGRMGFSFAYMLYPDFGGMFVEYKDI